MKKLTLYFVSVLALLVSASAYGQNRIKVTQETYALIGDSVHVEMTIDLNHTQVPSRASILMTPAIKSYTVTRDMPSVLINGRNRHRAYNRLVTLKKSPKYIHSEINAGDKKAPQTYKYIATIPYEMWMMDADFIVREEESRCSDKMTSISYDLLARKMEDRNPPLPPPYKDVEMNFMVSYKIPNPEPVKARSETGKAYLDFAAGKSVINPDYGNNVAELDKIGEMIRTIKANQYATVTGIVVEGYASPDGSTGANLRLSTNRAISLKNFIKNNYGYSENILTAKGKGEDWNSFTELVEQSDIANKEQIVLINRSAKPLDTRERALRALNRGATFKVLMTDIFPKLRRSDYELKYTIVPLTIEQGIQVIKTAPSNLSLNEMFLIAESYPKGSTEYNEVFEIAAKVYPDNETSVLNAAANALARNDVAMAETFLSKVKTHNGAYHNNMGVMHSLKGEYDKAAVYFDIAKTSGSKEAELNTTQIEKMKEVEGELMK